MKLKIYKQRFVQAKRQRVLLIVEDWTFLTQKEYISSYINYTIIIELIGMKIRRNILHIIEKL